MKALILVDIQNDFLPGGALAVPGGDEVIEPANRAQTFFELVVATKDWHPRSHVSFAANHPGKKPGDVVQCQGVSQILWPTHCVQGELGAELARDLDVQRIERVFLKGVDPRIDSYSAFFDNGRRKATGLGRYLRGVGVTDVYVMGLATDYCVKFTALDARDLGFRVFLLEDGCRAVDLSPGDARRAADEMRAAGVRVITTEKLTSP